jgi:hypothetical protein
MSECPKCHGNHFVRHPDGAIETCSCRRNETLVGGRALNEAGDLINGARAKDYGRAQENFRRIAAGWSAIFGQDVTEEQVALAMDWVKTARLIQTPNHHDSWVDKIGYAAFGAEVSSD